MCIKRATNSLYYKSALISEKKITKFLPFFGISLINMNYNIRYKITITYFQKDVP